MKAWSVMKMLYDRRLVTVMKCCFLKMLAQFWGCPDENASNGAGGVKYCIVLIDGRPMMIARRKFEDA